jgi:hypothetical protein
VDSPTPGEPWSRSGADDRGRLSTSQSSEGALRGTGRCGNAAQNLVDHSFTDQTSILRFIEDNWALPRIGGGSLDGIAGSIDGMFDFKHSHRDTLILDPKASSTGHCPTVRAGAGTSPPWLSSASPRPAD